MADRLNRYLHEPTAIKDYPGKIMSLATFVQEACKLDADAALATIISDDGCCYSASHSINSAVTAEIVAKKAGLPTEERLSLISASLTSNIAMLDLQNDLHKQDAPLTEAQKREVRRHADGSAELLHQLGIKDPVWLDAVLQHHESIDGSGYPLGLKGSEIATCARIISMSDFYCAKISGRAYRVPMTAPEAMRFVFQGSDSRLDSEMAQTFVKTLGMYLPGSFVLLNNGETAVVARRSEKLQCPVIYSVIWDDVALFSTPVRRDSASSKYAIEAVHPPDYRKVDVRKFKLWKGRSGRTHHFG